MSVKRIFCMVCALALCFTCLVFTGCSTPSVAVKVGSNTYEMGDYLAYMYQALANDYQIYSYYYYGYDVQTMTYSYGEDSSVTLSFKDYATNITKDAIIRQAAIESLMAKYNIPWNEKYLAEFNESLASEPLKQDAFIHLGFNNDRYIKMCKAIQLNETSLFLGLYDTNGQRAVSGTDEKAWFDDHYYSYKIIEISLANSSGADLSEEEQAAINKRLEGYLKIYQDNLKESGASEAFNIAYRKYVEDNEAKDTKATETTDTTTEATDKTEEEEKEPVTANRVDAVDDGESMDAELLKVLKELNFKEAGKEIAVKTYKKNGTAKTAALILRMDPCADRGKDEDGNEIDYYADNHEAILSYMKYDELSAEIDAKIAELKATAWYDQKAINAAKPEEILADLLGE